MTRPSRPPDLHLAIEPDSTAPRQARRALRGLLDDPDDPIAGDVELAASELVSNVVQHSNGGGEMRVWDPKPDVPLRLEVEDHDPTLPALDGAEVPADAASGRGLHIVQRVADQWGASATLAGKIIWAEFDRVKRHLRRS